MAPLKHMQLELNVLDSKLHIITRKMGIELETMRYLVGITPVFPHIINEGDEYPLSLLKLVNNDLFYFHTSIFYNKHLQRP